MGWERRAMSSGKATGTGAAWVLILEGGRQGSEPPCGGASSLQVSFGDPPLILGHSVRKEGRLLLAALVKAYVQRKTNELEQEEEQEETEDSR